MLRLVREKLSSNDSSTRLSARLAPKAETLWKKPRTQVDLNSSILVFDDTTLDKPYYIGIISGVRLITSMRFGSNDPERKLLQISLKIVTVKGKRLRNL
jgi:hypothetical protein